MRTYKIKVKLVFEGTVDVRGINRHDAKCIANKHWGVLLNTPHTSNESDSIDDEGIVNWDINPHPVTSKFQ